jgi:type IV pilus assembly protein PilM
MMGAIASAIQKFKPTANAKRVGPIGLECSLTELHLVQMKVSTDNVITRHAMTSIPYPESREAMFSSPKKMRALIHQAMGSDRFQGKHVISTLPSSDTRILQVAYRVQDGQSDDAALLGVLAERVDGDLKDYVIDYMPVRTKKRSEEGLAIVAVAQCKAVIDYLEILRKSGLITKQLEIGPSAIRRLVSAIGHQSQHENVLAINFGRDHSYLTVVSGKRLLLDQSVNLGETRLLESIATALDMPVSSARELVNSTSFTMKDSQSNDDVSLDIDIAGALQEIIKPVFLELAEEINRVLVYTASQTHGETVSRIFLLGSLARWEGIDQLLNSLVKLPVETIPDPLQHFGQPTRPSGNSQAKPEIAVATGLALNGMLKNDGY